MSELASRVAALGGAVRAHLGVLVVPLLAHPEDLAGVRGRVVEHLAGLGLHAYRESARVCVSELLSNVVRHIGPGTPVTLRVSATRSGPRLALTDPDPRSLPVLLDAAEEAESGRGLALLEAFSLRWGVDQHPDGKTVWCEPAPDPAAGG